MNRYEEKQERRRERLEARADRLQREGTAKVENGFERLRSIPFGQPILVGHYSEKGDRNFRRKAGASIDKGMELRQQAGEVAARAAAVGTGGISSDDPDAIVKLQAELDELQALQARMIAGNKIVRKFKGDAPGAIAALVASGFSANAAAAAINPPYAGAPVGFPGYRLSNNGANIRRITARIAMLRVTAKRESSERQVGDVTVIENAEENRIQLKFPGKPPADARALLKSWGFRWSPSEGAWQRMLNNAGIRAADYVLEKIQELTGPAQ